MDLVIKKWTKENYEEYIKYLIELKDEKYKEFHSKLIMDGSNLIGVRTPIMRKVAKEISKGDFLGFLELCEDNYYEEKMIEGMVIGLGKFEYDELCKRISDFAEKIDNWAINDSFCTGLRITQNRKKDFFAFIDTFLKSNNPWKIRVGLIIMLSKYLEDEYIEEVLKRCDSISNDFYYVRMGQAWLVATAYCKFNHITEKYLSNSNLDDWTFNKSIQKACESLRVTQEDKIKLRKMKRKNSGINK